MTVMLANGVIPNVNENDTISVSELMFTDNERYRDGCIIPRFVNAFPALEVVVAILSASAQLCQCPNPHPESIFIGAITVFPGRL